MSDINAGDPEENLLYEAVHLLRQYVGSRCPLSGHESIYAPRTVRVDCFDPQCINPECIEYETCKHVYHDAAEFLAKVDNRD